MSVAMSTSRARAISRISGSDKTLGSTLTLSDRLTADEPAPLTANLDADDGDGGVRQSGMLQVSFNIAAEIMGAGVLSLPREAPSTPSHRSSARTPHAQYSLPSAIHHPWVRTDCRCRRGPRLDCRPQCNGRLCTVLAVRWATLAGAADSALVT